MQILAGPSFTDADVTMTVEDTDEALAVFSPASEMTVGDRIYFLARVDRRAARLYLTWQRVQ